MLRRYGNRLIIMRMLSKFILSQGLQENIVVLIRRINPLSNRTQCNLSLICTNQLNFKKYMLESTFDVAQITCLIKENSLNKLTKDTSRGTIILHNLKRLLQLIGFIFKYSNIQSRR